MDIKSIILGALGLILGGGIVLATVVVTTKPVPATTPPLGAFAPESTDHICIGGACTYTYKQAINASSSMPCSIPFPNSGTSTVTYAGMQIVGNGLGTQTIDISTSSSPYGTSSLPFVWKRSVGSGAQASIAWEPAATTSAQLAGVNPLTGELNTMGTSTDFVNFKVATGTPGTFAAYYTGTCVASFRSLQ